MLGVLKRRLKPKRGREEKDSQGGRKNVHKSEAIVPVDVARLAPSQRQIHPLFDEKAQLLGYDDTSANPKMSTPTPITRRSPDDHPPYSLPQIPKRSPAEPAFGSTRLHPLKATTPSPTFHLAPNICVEEGRIEFIKSPSEGSNLASINPPRGSADNKIKSACLSQCSAFTETRNFTPVTRAQETQADFLDFGLVEEKCDFAKEYFEAKIKDLQRLLECERETAQRERLAVIRLQKQLARAILVPIFMTSLIPSCQFSCLTDCIDTPHDLGYKPDHDYVSITDVSAITGGVAKLPCDMKLPISGDKVYLIIWYKEGSTSPIYSFDSRGKALKDGKHWANEDILTGRAFFRANDDPARLMIENVKEQDAGIYRCRVDFKKSPTKNSKVNLTVIIPPERISVIDEKGHHIPHYMIGPYNEGSSVEITCIATGGRPSPRVSWWMENALIDDQYEQVSPKTVKNIMRLENIGRQYLNVVFTCQATNNNIIAPISSAITIDINLKPLSVQLKGENRPLSAETVYKIQCEAIGARPEPIITWWKGSLQLRNSEEKTSASGNSTVSTLTFIPKLEDSGKILTCRAGTPLLPNSSLEDSWKLNIYHIPIVTLELGSNIVSSAIREGVDVYFECNIKSNPWVYRVSWRHNGLTLYNNASAGTIISNQSLVLQSITRARAGLYTCVGSNQEGDGESNPVNLDVKFRPVCRPGQQKVQGVARYEVARVLCEVEANPPEVTFYWRFNNTSETIDIPQSHVVHDKLRSIASYTPMTELDYGSLLCWAKNVRGMQLEPCVFHVVPAGKPDPLSNCTIANQTSEIFLVECSEGFDGGLPQDFVMEIYDSQTQALVVNVTSKVPVFDVHSLESNIGFDISLYAVNAKGRSDITYLKLLTLKDAEKRTAGEGGPLFNFKITPLIIIACGAGAISIFILLISLIIIKLRKKKTHKKTCEIAEDNEKYPSCEDDNNPDVIPQSNESEYIDPDEKAFERLNNAPPRILASIPRGLQNAAYQAGYSVPELCKTRDEVTYVDLSLPRQSIRQMTGVQRCPLKPTEYAEIQVNKTLTPYPKSLDDTISQNSDSTISACRPLLETGTVPRLTATRF